MTLSDELVNCPCEDNNCKCKVIYKEILKEFIKKIEKKGFCEKCDVDFKWRDKNGCEFCKTHWTININKIKEEAGKDLV